MFFGIIAVKLTYKANLPEVNEHPQKWTANLGTTMSLSSPAAQTREKRQKTF
jgi:hypothetical protein